MLLAQLDQLLIEQTVDRWVVLTGGPGMGKSALLAQWLARREAAGNPMPHHFIRRGEYDWDDPAKLAASLVAQIVAQFPAPPEPEADAHMHGCNRRCMHGRRGSCNLFELQVKIEFRLGTSCA